MKRGKKRFFPRMFAALLAAAAMSGPALARPASENMVHMNEIAHAIANCGRLDGIDWLEVSAIFGMDDDGDVNESYGYAYDRAGKAHAVTFLVDPVTQAVERYRKWLRQDGDRGFIKILFQFNRDSRKVNADFEYENPARWQVTPKNIDTIVNELRPGLGK
jgi:hypothetical protein